MCKRSFLYFLAIVAMCILLPGNGYPVNLPTEYPWQWAVNFQPVKPLPAGYEFGRQTTILPQGTVYVPGALPLPCDIIWDRDVPMTMRDGAIIYCSIFRPAANPTNLPAILTWSTDKRSPSAGMMGGGALNWVSGWQAGEGPDPAYWCNHGYAIVMVNIRGRMMSEGNAQWQGMVNAADGYDFVEWVGTQDWSNGKVSFTGASWLAFTTWPIAALNPPHLTCFAPWNGFTDLYRDHLAPGGIPDAPTNFPARVANGWRGLNYGENIGAMVTEHPTMVPYWQDKATDLEAIKMPCYVIADNATTIHRTGAYEGFRRISSKEKWFRANTTNEWYDEYNPKYVDDLRKFYDHYMKGIDNGWEKTPRVRMPFFDAYVHCSGSSLDSASCFDINDPTYGSSLDLVDVPFSQLPMAETQYQKFYLDAAMGTLSTNPIKNASSVSYNATTGRADFTITFNEDTYVAGYIKLRLWVQADGANDMDLVPLVEKLDAQGNVLQPAPYGRWFYDPSPPGTQGRLRVSLRALDQKLSTDFFPVPRFLKNDYLIPGEIVPVEIAMQPDSFVFHAGQQLRLTVAGHIIDVVPSGLGNAFISLTTINSGNHIIHAGSKYDSYLQLPIIPAEAITAAMAAE